MKFLLFLLLAAGLASAQSYSAVRLTGVNNVIELNNTGAILVFACVGSCPGTQFPAVWNNGVLTSLPIPDGYSFNGVPGYWHINDSGIVVGSVLSPVIINGGNPSQVALWQNGTATIVQPPPVVCGGVTSSFPSDLNRAGHVLIRTQGPSCDEYWLYPANVLDSFQPPSPCTWNFDDATDASINDADNVVETIKKVVLNGQDLCPAIPARYQPVLIQPGGSFSYLPTDDLIFGGLSGYRAETINNLGDVAGIVDNLGPGSWVVWDNNGQHLLPAGLINNVGQVLYRSGGQIFVWQNGVSTAIQLPSVFPRPQDVVLASGVMNDAGQFTVIDTFFGGLYLLTPSGPCGQDITSQIQVERGGFRYSHTAVRFAQAVTVTNSTGSSITGPISLAFDSLPPTASVFGISGATECLAPAGSPYVNVSGTPLDSGNSVTTTLQFINADKSGISYLSRVVTGAARR